MGVHHWITPAEYVPEKKSQTFRLKALSFPGKLPREIHCGVGQGRYQALVRALREGREGIRPRGQRSSYLPSYDIRVMEFFEKWNRESTHAMSAELGTLHVIPPVA